MSPLILGIAAAGAGFAITAAVLWVVCLRSNRKRNRAVADTDADTEAAPASSASNPSLSAASSLAATLQHLPLAATTSTAPHPTSQPAQPAAQGSPDDDDQLLLSPESLALFERAPPSAQPAGLAPGSRGAAARSTARSTAARRRLDMHGRVARSAWDSGAAPPAGAPPTAGATPNSKCDDRSPNDAADAAANLELAAIHQRTPSQIMRNPIRTDESIGGLYLEVAKRADRETRIILFPRVANYAGLGLTLKGNAPVAICDVDFASPAYVGGCVEGDILVAINGVPCANWSHDQVVEVFIAALDRERHLAVARGWSAKATNAPPPPKPASDTLIVSDWADEPVNDMDDISLLPGTTASDSQPELEAAPAPAPTPPPPIQNPTTTTTTTTTPTTAEGLREEAIRYQKDAAKLMLQGRYAQAHDCLDRAIELLARTEKLTAPSPAPASSPRRRSLFRRLSSDSNRIVPIQHKDATTPLPGLALFRPIGPDQLSESPSHPHPNPTVEAAPVPAKHAFPRRNSSSSLLSLRRHSSRATVAPALSEADSGYSTDLPSPDVATPTRELRTSGSGPFRRLSFVSVKSLSPIAAQDETQFFTDASESDNVNHATVVHVRSAANLDGDREEDQLEEEGSGFTDMHAHTHTQMQTQTQTPTHTHGDGAQSKKAGPQRQAWGAPNPHPNAHAALVRKPASLFDKPTFPQPARFAVGAGDDPVVGAVRSELAELIAAASSAPGENLAGDGRSITVGGWMDGLSD